MIQVSQKQSSSSSRCTQQLDNILIYYSVEAPQHHERSTSEGSGAEDVVRVNSIRLLTDEDNNSVTSDMKDVDRR